MSALLPGIGTVSTEVRDGQFVNARVARIVDAIREYSPELEVQWIPEAARRRGQAAYRIIHNPPGAEPYVLFHVRRDEDFDHRVLQRIIQNDQRNGQQTLSDLDAFEETQKQLARQDWLNTLEEMNDIAYHVLKSPKNKYVVDKNTVIRDYGGII